MNGRTSRSRTLRTAAVAAAALAAATLAVAAASRDSGGPRVVLHERVEGLASFRWNPDDARPDLAARRPVTDPGLAAAPPTGSLDEGDLATTAAHDSVEPDGFPSVAPPGPGDDLAVPPAPAGRVSDRPPDSFAPDLATDRRSIPDPTVPAGILWNPAPGPYLRQQVFDTVRDDGTLVAPRADGPGLRDPEPPTGAAGHERFLGRARLEVRDRAPIRLATPAPEFRAAISAGARDGDRLAVDRAGNLFLVPGPTPGPRDLILSLETDARAFGGPLDPAARLADVPAALRPSFPAPLESSARRVADALGLSADLPVETLLRLLTTHFRSYGPGPPPTWRSGTAYEQLALGGVGLCRHRAYAFVVTAQALGLPVRMPVSRLHAWVEALVPVADRSGRRWLWRRIDLGGAYGAPDETLADIPAHVPERPDPFGWPRGARPTATGTLPAPGPVAAADGTGANGARNPASAGLETPSPATGAPPAPTPVPPATAAPSVPASTPPATLSPRVPTPATVPAPSPAAVPNAGLLLPATIEHFPLDANRGETVEVSGRVIGGAPPGALVQIVLERPGGERRELGALALTRNGRFGGRLALPADVPPGDYTLRADLLPW